MITVSCRLITFLGDGDGHDDGGGGAAGAVGGAGAGGAGGATY